VFRAGYYGTLVPLPALAKSASHAEWSRGYEYLMRLVKPHLLYVPAAVLAAVVVANRRTMVAPRRVVFAAPLVAAALLALYVIRVGGDFMHARLLLPATFLMVAPVLLVPRGRWIGPAAALAARHAMTCGDLAELLTSVRAPMTASRFWANLAGSVRRTRLIIPADPVEAERALCGP
jgi:arabinofuranosyltransferase